MKRAVSISRILPCNTQNHHVYADWKVKMKTLTVCSSGVVLLIQRNYMPMFNRHILTWVHNLSTYYYTYYFFFFFYIQTVPTAYFKSESNKIAFILFSHTDELISTAEPGTQSIARASAVDCDSVRFCSGFVNIVRSFDHVRIGYVV